jgi:hypothetical protein
MPKNYHEEYGEFGKKLKSRRIVYERKERNQLDARIQVVYRTAFQIYRDNLLLKFPKTTLRSSSAVAEAGIISKQKRPLDCETLALQFLSISRDAPGVNTNRHIRWPKLFHPSYQRFNLFRLMLNKSRQH